MRNFGRHLLSLWHLDPDAVHLNHGSFGAVPKSVLKAQSALREEMERQPDQFFRRKIMPGTGDSAVRAVAAQLAAFVATKGERLALVENATAGINAVLGSFPFEPGDEILFTDHTYNAVRICIEETCRRTGAIPKRVEIAIPADPAESQSRIVEAAGPRTRLALIDHVTSPSAILLPIAEIVRELKLKGVLTLIDGAHGLGQVPLDLTGLGADWYTSNAHKWLYAPKGTAFLFAAETVAKLTRSLSVSHFHGLSFPSSFDYTGTRDNTGWLTLPACLEFVAQFGAERMRAYKHGLAIEAREIFSPLGLRPTAADEMTASMRAFILPQGRPVEAGDVPELMNELWSKHRIQVNVSVFAGRLLMRICAQIYNERADIERLAAVLEREGWPGRCETKSERSIRV